MSRVARKPLLIPNGVEIKIDGAEIKIKGPKGSMQLSAHEQVVIKQENNSLSFVPQLEMANAEAVAGTIKALIRNMLIGVTQGFERKLMLVGVSFKAQMQGNFLNLSLGFSHAIKFSVPAGLVVEAPSQTEVVVKGVDKHLVGQVAAKIRALRPPEPYKGKGIRYEGEVIVKKEGKKK